MSPIADPHVCKPPATAEEVNPGVSRKWRCSCERTWHTEWFSANDGYGPMAFWILDEEQVSTAYPRRRV